VLIGGIVVLALVFIAGFVFIGGGGDDTDQVEAGAASSTSTVASIPVSYPPPPPVEIPEGGFTTDQVAANFGDAVWRIDTTGCGVESGGTGFAISPHHIVTNWHVVVIDPLPELVSRDGTRRIDGRVIGMSDTPDVAVIEVAEPLTSYLEWAPTESLTEGQSLVALGYPRPQLNFTVNPIAIASFESEGPRRTGILADGRIDRGNSGGPSLTTEGKVAGVNTAVNINQGASLGALSGGGFQVVPYLGTYEGLRASVDAFMANTGGDIVEADCGAIDPSKAMTYGDNEDLDFLWEFCDGGDSAACDQLAAVASATSEYYLFGVTCGARMDRAGYCYVRWGPVLPPRG
jgi:hypothetical protein